MNKSAFILLLALLEGFFFVAFEIIGVQLLQPVFGSSHFIWVITISVVMVASALGYFLGSFLVFLQRKKRLMVDIIIVVFITFAGARMIGYTNVSENLFVKFQDYGTLTALIVHAFFMVGIPVIMITSFSPLLVQAYREGDQQKRNPASMVFTVSTVGGVISIYLIAFGLLPEYDLIFISKVFGIMLGISGAAMFLFRKKLIPGILQGILTFLIVIIFTPEHAFIKKGNNTVVIDRIYGIQGEIEVREETIYNPKYQRNDVNRVLSVNRMQQTGVALRPDQTGKMVPTKLSSMTYPFRMSTYVSGYPEGAKILVAGLGGGALVNQLRELKFDVDVVDLDGRLFDVALEYMALDTTRTELGTGIHFIEDDIRHYVQVSENRYNVIILDLSKGESIPTNVYTIEAFRQMKKLLSDDGLIMINYFSRAGKIGETGMHSVMKSLKRAGFFVGVIKQNASYSEKMIVASDRPHPNIIPQYPLRMPQVTIQSYNLVAYDFVEIIPESAMEENAVYLYDDQSALEKQQFEVILDYRTKSRNYEYRTFFDDKKNKK